MAVIEKGKITSLSDSSLKDFENNVVKYESLVRRKKQDDSQLSKSNKKISRSGGMFSENTDTLPLPSNITKKQRNSGMSRADHSNLLSKFKLKDKTSNSAFEHATEWKKSQDRIKAIEKEQRAFKKMFANMPAFIGGAASFGSAGGIISSLTGLVSRVPYVAAIIAVATTAAQKYVEQYRDGGTRDTRVKRLDESSALTSIHHETEIFGGEIVFVTAKHISWITVWKL